MKSVSSTTVFDTELTNSSFVHPTSSDCRIPRRNENSKNDTNATSAPPHLIYRSDSVQLPWSRLLQPGSPQAACTRVAGGHVELIAIRCETRFALKIPGPPMNTHVRYHLNQMPNCRIENKDSKDYSLDGKVSGSSSSIKIPKGTTTISWSGSGDFVLGSGSSCTFPDGKIVGGTNYTISGGKASK